MTASAEAMVHEPGVVIGSRPGLVLVRFVAGDRPAFDVLLDIESAEDLLKVLRQHIAYAKETDA